MDILYLNLLLFVSSYLIMINIRMQESVSKWILSSPQRKSVEKQWIRDIITVKYSFTCIAWFDSRCCSHFQRSCSVRVRTVNVTLKWSGFSNLMLSRYINCNWAWHMTIPASIHAWYWFTMFFRYISCIKWPAPRFLLFCFLSFTSNLT